MKMKHLAGALLALFSVASSAQYQGSPPSEFESGAFLSSDSDGFRESNVWTGAKFKVPSANVLGIGPRVGAAQYSGDLGLRVNSVLLSEPLVYQNNRITANGGILQGAFVYQNSLVDLHGAIGVKQLSYNVDATDVDRNLDSALDTITNMTTNRVVNRANKELAKTGDSLSSSDVSDIRKGIKEYLKQQMEFDKSSLSGTKNYLIGDVELRVLLNPYLTLGLVGAADNVASPMSIVNGVFYYTLAPTVDINFSDTWNLSVISGNTHFSDSNNRHFIRNKLSWVFLPEYGLSTYLRFNAQKDTDAGSPNYYSPENLKRVTLGFKARKRYEGLLWTAAAEYGREFARNTARGTDWDDNVTSNVYYWNLGVQTPQTKESKVTFSFNVSGTNVNQAHASSDGKYRWTGASAWVNIPF